MIETKKKKNLMFNLFYYLGSNQKTSLQALRKTKAQTYSVIFLIVIILNNYYNHSDVILFNLRIFN